MENMGEAVVLKNGSSTSTTATMARNRHKRGSIRAEGRENQEDPVRRPEEDGYFVNQGASTLGAVSNICNTDICVDAFDEEQVGEFLDAAFRRLVGVGKRRGSGNSSLRVVREKAGVPSLVEMAPAVWNLRYLQVSRVYLPPPPFPQSQAAVD